jgi:hypothetical protein
MDKKISELTELTHAKAGDILPIVDSASPISTKKITSSNFRNTYVLPISVSDVTGLQTILDAKLNQNVIIDGGAY